MAKAGIDLSAFGSDVVVISSAFQSKSGHIYIGTRGAGLFMLEKGSRKLVRVECRLNGLDLNTAKIWCIQEDNFGNLWLGCQSKGLVMIPKIQPQFSSWSFTGQGYRISSTITAVCEGDQGITWCVVQGSGVYGFDQQGHIVAHPASPPSSEFMYRDKKGRYWIGNNESLFAYNPLTGASQRQVSFICEKLNDMTDMGNGQLFISTYSRGLSIYNPDDHTFKNYLSTQTDHVKGQLHNNWILAMMPDKKGCVWMATSSGVSCYDPQKDNFRPYGWDNLLDGKMCYSLCEQKNGDVLIGTDQGLFVYHQGDQEAMRFQYGDALATKVVGYIVEAMNGDIWCATSMGIWQFDIRKNQFVGHVNGNGLTMKEYVNCVGLHTDNDMIYFANNDGLTVFNAAQVTGSHKDLPAIKLTSFFIAGNPVNTLTESDGRLVAKGPVIETDKYQVSYLDNSITLEFSLLDFVSPRNIVYEYRINEAKWLQTPEGQNSIQLSHLQPGTYQIEVRALSAGIYSEKKIITVKVLPPWYRSGWAYTVYLLVVFGIIGVIGLLLRRSARQHMDEEKMKFLINATHDIRSPLTLIMGPLDKLKTIIGEGEGKGYLETIDRNAQRLMLLVNQILDERRIDKNQLQLHCRETNMVDFIGGICKLYQYNASQRNITFTFEHEKDHVLAWVDRINFDKVISNLLSNAFKYTFDGGEVKVMLHETEKEVEIQVLDNGVGIKEEEAERLFDRFYQGRNSDDLGMQGTGIGLNLCRSITQMHKGQIKAQNRKDGMQGACFTVSIPKGHAHLKPEQMITETPATKVLSAGTAVKQQFRRFNILIVDDDQEIANYIIGELGGQYKFDHRPNGKEGLKALLTQQYDLVISDVMMPEMDGITMLKRIKDHPQISQIPVIMLTSKAEVEHKLIGLKSGADAYIAKPFSMEELHIQIDNLIDNVRRLRGKFSGAVDQEQRVEKIEVKGNDDALMERIMRSVNAKMSDPDYNIDTLASDVGISRAQLHRKMKEMTGISSGKFLRNLRMEQAARLLREGKINISQVADKVGYMDQAHFSIAFKSHFGMSPSEYVETHKS
jgi:signal transduction histidine kinase/DNA-binding response OmpR family regulator